MYFSGSDTDVQSPDLAFEPISVAFREARLDCASVSRFRDNARKCETMEKTIGRSLHFWAHL